MKKSAMFTKIIGYGQNRGKGNAVSFGVKHSSGDKILFIDADGSIPPEEILGVLKKLDKFDFVAGNRLSKQSRVETGLLRKIFSLGFNTLVSIIFQYSYRDNLCGFKGFKMKVAQNLFLNLTDRRWVFDVELFYKAKKRGYSVYFLPIEWHYVGGSRINMFVDPIKWIFRLIKLRFTLASYK